MARYLRTSCTLALLLTIVSDGSAASQLAQRLRHHRTSKRQLGPAMIDVPAYNISTPIDHFNVSDNRVFNNRFWVNDTYYKPGGPVVYFDFGEVGVIDQYTSEYLAGWNGTISAPLEVAKAFNGVVVAMEHRYYGLSLPFPVNASNPGEESGGAAAYKYLTIEQALEDVVYLAKSFNQIQLTSNAAFSGQNATAQLGPGDTPWLFIGGSYPGNRAVWSRLRSPDVWFAVWASSAPLQSEPGAAAYYNPVYRGIPPNCSTDIQTVVNTVDAILSGPDEDEKLNLKRMIFLANQLPFLVANQGLDAIDESISYTTDAVVVQNLMPQTAFSNVQNSGIPSTMQKHCDWMEQFNIKSYVENASQFPANSFERLTAALYNPGDAVPRPKGISSYQNSSLAVAAYLYAVGQDQLLEVREEAEALAQLAGQDEHELIQFEVEFEHSWSWQQLMDLGFLEDWGNKNNPLRLTSTLLNLTWARNSRVSYVFPDFPADAIPAVANTSYALSFGGWSAKASNTMWTSGEFDPWRAYTVFTQEQDTIGAPPERCVTQKVPACNAAPAGTNVFGIVYGGASHAEDMSYTPGDVRGAEGTPPVVLGAELFVEALKVWLPCFKVAKG